MNTLTSDHRRGGPFARRLLLALGLSVALAFGASAAAGAAPGGTPQTFETGRDGAGAANTDASADGATGALWATSSATGGGNGGGGGPIGGLLGNLFPNTGPTIANAKAQVSGGGDVTEGVYEVTVTYSGSSANEARTGSGESEGFATSEAGYFGENSNAPPGETQFVGSGFAELPSEPGTTVIQYEVTIPGDGSLGIIGAISANSNANGRGNSGSTESTVQGTDISFQKIG